MTEKKNKLKREKRKVFPVRREAKILNNDAYFKCGKKGHYKIIYM